MPASQVIDVAIPPRRKGLSLVFEIRKDPLHFFQQLERQTDGFAWLSIAGRKVLVLNDATAIEYVFTKGARNYHKGIYNFGLKPVFGAGIFLAEEEDWKRQKLDMAPNFTGQNYEGFVRDITASVTAMIERWQPRIRAGQPIDFAGEASWLTFDVILRALYHQTSGNNAHEIRTFLGSFLKMAESRIWALFNFPLRLTMLRPKNFRTMRFLDKLTHGLIAQRRIDGQYPADLLSRLIVSHGPDRREQARLRDNVLSFMLAGQETTGNAISWAMYELGRNAGPRQTMITEIDAVLSGDDDIDLARAKQLRYVGQVFSETMRKYAPAWTMSRRALVPDLIPLADGRLLKVPKNATVMLPAYTVQNSTRYWDEPEAFRPERFMPAAVAGRPKYAYFPFGGGSRICLGARLAELEGILAIALIYKAYDVELIDGQVIRPEPVITLRPDKPIYIRLTPRQPAAASAPERARSDQNGDQTARVCPYAAA